LHINRRESKFATSARDMTLEIDKITVLLFDWDGTLYDSAQPGYVAFEKTFLDLGMSFSREFYDKCYSPNWYAMYEALGLPGSEWQKADDMWLEHYGEQPPKLVDGAAETIFGLKDRGFQLGIVTSGTQRRVTREISQLNLNEIFDVVICNEHISQKKPHPEGLNKAMAAIGCQSSGCSYIGDAPEDIQMGKQAGVLTIGVQSAYPTSRLLQEEGPDIHLKTISELLHHFQRV